MTEPLIRYLITPQAGQFIAGRLRASLGSSILLTEAEALYELLLGAIVPEGGTVPPPEEPDLDEADRLLILRDGSERQPLLSDFLRFIDVRSLLPFRVALLADATAAAIEAAREALTNLPGGVPSKVMVQAEPAAVWVLVHNLGRYPSVTLIDLDGEEFEGPVHYRDADTIEVRLSEPIAGRALLN